MRAVVALLAILASGLLLAPSAAADAPLRLSDYVTDHAGALSAADRAEVDDAVDTLYADRHLRLWVIYVDSFDGQPGQSWGRATAARSDFGDYDALLAVATGDRSYAFLVASAAPGVSASHVDELRGNQIEPALHRGDWTGAAVAAASGLQASASSGVAWGPLLIVLGLVAVAGAVLLVVLRWRRRRRRAAALAAAARVDPTDVDALAAVPLEALDDLSRAKVVDVDNALRTSTNELTLAVEEFGAQRTEPFTDTVEAARAALTRAFDVRQRLDDAMPETRAQQREMLTGVIVAAAKADRELEAQREAFEELRDLVINAPSRLDTLTQHLVELTARIPAAQQRLSELHTEFDTGALASVSGNVRTAKKRVSFADHNITRARELAANAVAGRQGDLVDAVRAAEAALGQVQALLDAVDSAAGDIRHAVATLPAAITDAEAGIAQADAQLKTSGPHAAELSAARAVAVRAVAAARGANDPLGAFTELTHADAALDTLLDTVAEEQAAAERLTRLLEQAVFTAQSRVRAVSDYIDTRRGSIGPEARTRLAEARRRLEAAQTTRGTDVSGAITQAHRAAALAASAQTLAQSDAAAAQRAHYGRYRNDESGAMLGGIIIGDVLRGGRGGFGGFGAGRGGSGGWSPTSFGGSGGSSGGGFFGGGGRF